MPTPYRPGAGWLRVVMQNGTPEFDAAFRPDAVLQASVLRKPLVGPRLIAAFFSATSRMYERIAFTAETAGTAATYLEWEGQAFGIPVAGTTIVRKDAAGLIAGIRLFHSPYGVVQPFSQELARRLAGTLGPDHFG